MSVTTDQVTTLINTTIEATKTELSNQIKAIADSLKKLEPPSVEEFKPVELTAISAYASRERSLDLIKSLSEFKGDMETYPAWRKSVIHAMQFYNPDSDNFYVATGILRNKVIGAANSILASYNTVLNYKAILQRLDETYLDTTPLHVLENDFSTFRQGNLSIVDFYNKVERHLTLIINRQLIEYAHNEDLMEAFNERARATALNVFISGLRRQWSNAIFSAKPKNLPSALSIAKELESNNKRYNFAKIYADGTAYQKKEPAVHQPMFNNQSYRREANSVDRPVPMDVDPSTIRVRKPSQRFNPNLPNMPGEAFKRQRESSERSRFKKSQKVNHVPTEPKSDSDDQESCDEVETFSDAEVSSSDEVNFLG